MDRNLLLAFALSFAVLLAWSSFVEPPPPPAPEATEGSPSGDDIPSTPSTASALPELSPAGESKPLTPVAPEPTSAPAPSRTITIDTPLFAADLDTRGAGLTRFELNQFHASDREGGAPIQLITGSAPFGTG